MEDSYPGYLRRKGRCVLYDSTMNRGVGQGAPAPEFCYGDEGRLRLRARSGSRRRIVAAVRSFRSYLPIIFFPKLYFVPTVTRMVLRPPFSMSENML